MPSKIQVSPTEVRNTAKKGRLPLITMSGSVGLAENFGSDSDCYDKGSNLQPWPLNFTSSSSSSHGLALCNSSGNMSVSTTRSKRASVNAPGNEINKKHEQFDLSVAMMLGIRFSVGKTWHDERQRRKQGSFDGTFGNEDFQKVDKSIFPYAPEIITK